MADQEFNFTGRSAPHDPTDTLVALTWGTPPAAATPTQEFNFTARSPDSDPADVLLALTWGTPPAVITPTQEFNFTARSAPNDPADVLLPLTWGTPPAVVTPTQEFNFTTRRGPHDSADVVLAVTWNPLGGTIQLPGIPPPDGSLPVVIGAQLLAFEGIPPPEQSRPIVSIPFDQYILIDEEREATVGTPVLTQLASNIQVIAPLASTLVLHSTPRVSLRTRVLRMASFGGELQAGYGSHTLSHPPGPRNFTMVIEGIEPELPGWHKLTRKNP